MASRVRIVVAALDDAGDADVVARALRDAGIEVVHTGVNQTLQQVVRAVIQEDAAAVAIVPSSDELVRQTAELLAADGADDIAVVPSGRTAAEIVDWVRTTAAAEAQA